MQILILSNSQISCIEKSQKQGLSTRHTEKYVIKAKNNSMKIHHSSIGTNCMTHVTFIKHIKSINYQDKVYQSIQSKVKIQSILSNNK